MRNENWSVFEEQQRWAKIAEYIYFASRPWAKNLADIKDFRDKDIDAEDQNKYVEFKCEPRAIKSRNFYVELRNASNKKHDGMGYFYYSQADYICFIDMRECIIHWFDFASFRKWLLNAPFEVYTNGEDSGYLLPICCLWDWAYKGKHFTQKFDKKILDEALKKYGIKDINAVS